MKKSNTMVLERSEFSITLDDLIETFSNADLRLMLAIEQDQNDLVKAASLETQIAIEKLFSFECKNQQERKKLGQFLAERFVLGNNTSGELKKRACHKILTFITG